MAAGEYLHQMREKAVIFIQRVMLEEERVCLWYHTRIFGSLSKLQCHPHATEVGGAIGLFSNKLFPGQHSCVVLGRPGKPPLELWTCLKVEEERMYNILLSTGVYLCVYLRISSQIARYHVTRTLAIVSSGTADQQRDTRLVQTLVIYLPIYGYVLENLHA